MAEYHGTNAYVELATEVRYNNRQGNTKTRIFTGIYSSLYSLADQILTNKQAGGDQKNVVNMVLSKPSAEGDAILTVDYAIDVLYNWTYQINLLEKNIWLHPMYYNLFTDRYNQNMVRLGLLYGLDYGRTIAEIGTAAGGYDQYSRWLTSYNTLSAGQKTTLQTFYEMLQQGVEAYPLGQIVLRKQTLTEGEQLNLNVSTAATNFMMLNTTINSVWGPVDSTIYAALPSSSYYLYRGPTTDQLSNGKFQKTEEWWEVEKYAEPLYTIYTP